MRRAAGEAARQLVPNGQDVTAYGDSLARVAESLSKGGALCVTGAGCSTESGIPDYRSPGGSYSVGYKPMTHQQFMKSEYQRRRYWARAYLAWPSFDARIPNDCHQGLLRLQDAGVVGHIITQNVDGLHRGRRVVDLHGRLDQVICMDCRRTTPREEWHADTSLYNPELATQLDPTASLDRSDGDAEVGVDVIENFRVPPCRSCCGLRTKPHVVLFGDSVPLPRVERCYELVRASSSVVVCGSSLAVFSSWRFVKEAARLGLPIHIINIGKTRADELAAEKIEARAGDAVSSLAALLAPG
eukprot:TRINITY_DN3462_c0_g2_i1.p1 TRINITY_DN3462_c0_g2~~TRINITY_DN3462_c0_g2_i1.p1  ORF type:complete len:300 (+),score=86.78 TRINITY_DN3462_c0_g2_i1:132-1031(+)